MRVSFHKKFSKDLDKISQTRDRKAISKIVLLTKEIETLTEISGVKKLQGFQNAFRIRAGNYRIGVFVNGDMIEFARVAHRKDIYKIFP